MLEQEYHNKNITLPNKHTTVLLPGYHSSTFSFSKISSFQRFTWLGCYGECFKEEAFGGTPYTSFQHKLHGEGREFPHHFVVQEDGMSENLQMMIANQIEVHGGRWKTWGWFYYSNTFCEDNAGNSSYAWKCATSLIAHKAPCNSTGSNCHMSHVGQGQLIRSQQVYHLGPSIDGSHQVAEMHRWSKWQLYESKFIWIFFSFRRCCYLYMKKSTFHISIPFETLGFLVSDTKSLVVAPLQL